MNKGFRNERRGQGVNDGFFFFFLVSLLYVDEFPCSLELYYYSLSLSLSLSLSPFLYGFFMFYIFPLG